MRDVWACPVLWCDAEYSLPPDDGSAQFARSVAALAYSHAETHPPADYLATINELQRQLDRDEWVL